MLYNMNYFLTMTQCTLPTNSIFKNKKNIKKGQNQTKYENVYFEKKYV